MSGLQAKKIGLYGGAFDPPHWGHVLVISQILNEGIADEVLVVPSGNRVDKKYHSSAVERREMVQILFDSVWKNESRVAPLWIQLEEKMPGSFSIDLVRWFKKERPHDDPALVIGQELLGIIPSWHLGRELLTEASFVVVHRPESPPLTGPVSDRVFPLKNSDRLYFSISSTAVRGMLRKKYSLSGMVPEEISRYISDHQLYAS